MTIHELIIELSKLRSDLKLYTISGASGCSSEVFGLSVREVSEHDNIGDLCDVPRGTTVALIYVER